MTVGNLTPHGFFAQAAAEPRLRALGGRMHRGRPRAQPQGLGDAETRRRLWFLGCPRQPRGMVVAGEYVVNIWLIHG